MNKYDSGCYDCEETLARLHQYVDRELSEVEIVEVRHHLADCPPCERHFEFEERLKLLVHRNACPERAPEQLVDRILGSLKRA